MAGVTELYRRNFQLFGIALKRYRFLHEVLMEKVGGRGVGKGRRWKCISRGRFLAQSSTAKSNQIQPGVYTTLAYFTTEDLTLSTIAD